MRAAGAGSGLLQSRSLRDYLRILRRRKWIVIQVAIVAPVAALGLSLMQPHAYSASAEVLLSNQNLATALTGAQQYSGVNLQADRVAQTQADLARAPEVARRALARAGVHAPPLSLLSRSSVTAKANADLLDFSVTDRSAPVAMRLATAYAQEFVRYRKQLDTASIESARNEVERRLAQLSDQKGALYQNLVEKDQELATMETLQGANASVVTTPADAAQVQPRPVRNAVLGLALGLVLGLALALLWETLDTRVRSAEEIGEILGSPLIGRLPAPPKRIREANQLAMFADSGSEASEAFRMLRTNLAFVRLMNQAKAIMVTSAVEQEGKSTTVANLAIALARAGQRVVLVDLDLRRPALDRFFDLRGRPGLAEVATGQATLEEAITVASTTGAPVPPTVDDDAPVQLRPPRPILPSLLGGSLHLVAAGAIPPNASEFVGSGSLGVIMSELRTRFDTVLIDAPPVLQVGDAMALSVNVDAILVVTRMKVVRRAMLSELRRQLDASPAHTLGYVVTDAEGEGGYGYGYGSYGVTIPEAWAAAR